MMISYKSDFNPGVSVIFLESGIKKILPLPLLCMVVQSNCSSGGEGIVPDVYILNVSIQLYNDPTAWCADSVWACCLLKAFLLENCQLVQNKHSCIDFVSRCLTI